MRENSEREEKKETRISLLISALYSLELILVQDSVLRAFANLFKLLKSHFDELIPNHFSMNIQKHLPK